MNLKYAMNTTARSLSALMLVALAAGCAAPGQGAGGVPDAAASVPVAAAAPAPQIVAPQITVPAVSVATWYDLGTEPSTWLGGAGAVPVSGPHASTRAVGLRRDDGHWLAVVVVQAAPASGAPVCPKPNSAHVEGAFSSDCLRMRRDADLDRWLPTQHSELWEWLEERDLTSKPRAWVGDRVSAGGCLLEVHALVDPAFIEAATRNNTDFLAAGAPGQEWAIALAAATRAAAGGAALAIPPFPYMPRVAPPVSPTAKVVVAPPEPTRATQVPQPEAKHPVLAPRRDRE